MVRSKIKRGSVVKYKNRRYVVVMIDFLNGGNTMEIGIVRLYKNWHPMMLSVKYLWDEMIEHLELLEEE